MRWLNVVPSQEELNLGKRLMAENYPQIVIKHIQVIQSGGIKTIWKLETSVGTVCLKRIRKSIPIVKFTTAAQAYLYQKEPLLRVFFQRRMASYISSMKALHWFSTRGSKEAIWRWIGFLSISTRGSRASLNSIKIP